MKKKIFIIVGSTVILLLISVIVLPIIFKDKIVAKVKEEANKNLNAKIDFGTFDLSLIRSFPDFSLSLNNLSLVGVNEFEKDTLIYTKSFDFTIDLMSVIGGKNINIKSFILDEPRINAIVLEDGKANWDITKPSDETAGTAPGEPSAFKASLKKYEIKNGSIIYDDREGKMFAELIGLNHSGSGDFTQDLFVLSTNTTIDKLTYKDAGVPYLYKVNTIIKADLDMDMPNFKFTFKENEIQLNQLFLGFSGWLAMPGDDIDMDITYFAKKTEFKNILSLVPAVYSKDFESVKTSGKLALDGFVKGKYSEKTMPGFGVKLLVEDGMFQYPDLPKAVKNMHIDLKVDNKDGVPDHTVIDLRKFYMEMAENPLDMKMLVTTPESDAHLKGEIKGTVLLSSIKDVVPLEEGESLNGTIKADVSLDGHMSAIEKEQYEQFNFAGQFIVLDMDYKAKDSPYDMTVGKMYLNFSPQYVELSTFESKIGKSDINANGRIDNLLQYALKDELLTGTFNLNSTLIDLNEFMAEEESSPAETTGTEKEEETPMSVIEVPGNINFALNTSISKMLYDKLEITNVSGALKIADKKVAMENLKMNMMDGTLVLNGSYETKDIKKPSVNFAMEIADFDIQKTSKNFLTVEKLAPVAKNCFGKFSANMSLSGLLDEKMEPELKSLNGKGSLNTKAVTVQNFAPVVKLAEAVKMDKYKKLDLNDVNLSFEFKNGRVNIDPFDVKIGNSNANIVGSTGFDQSIDYTWKMDVPSSEFGGAANLAAGLLAQLGSKTGTTISVPERIKFNVLIGGTVTDPKVKVNFAESQGAAGSATDNLKDMAKEELEKKKAELEAKAREEAEKIKGEAEAKAKAEADKLKAEAEKAKKEAEAKAKAEADRLKAEAEKKKKQAEEEAKKKLKGLLKKP